jgi:predicted GTPase
MGTREFLLIGQTHVGKTLFLLNFCEQLGIDKVDITFSYPDAFETRQSYPIDVARRELVGTLPHKTRAVQKIELEVPCGKGKKTIRMVDPAGLVDGIHGELEVRQAMAQTLMRLRGADFILHMFNAALPPKQMISEVDRHLAEYARERGGYVILANQMDKPDARTGLAALKEAFSWAAIVPVSALTGQGLREVRSIVAHLG